MLAKSGEGHDQDNIRISRPRAAIASAASTAQAEGDQVNIVGKLVGTWRFISASSWVAGADKNDDRSSLLRAGFITYTSDGRVMAILRHGGRKPLSSGGDRMSASVEERAEAFATFFAYAGCYSLAGDKIIHHVEIASVENWANTDLVRLVRFEEDRITLTTSPLSVGGRIQTTELIWERHSSLPRALAPGVDDGTSAWPWGKS